MFAARFLSLVFLLLAFFPSCSFFSHDKHDVVATDSCYTVAVDQTANLNKDLLALLEFMNIKHDGSLADVVAKTQAQWLRAAGKERWEMPELLVTGQTEFLSILRRLGFIAELQPTKNSYDYALLLGATLSRVRLRLGHLVTLWNQGIRFDRLVLLGGQRVLEKNFEGEAALLDRSNTDLPIRKEWQFTRTIPTTEIEMMRCVYDQADMPELMRKVPVTFVDSLMRQRADGALVRPTTIDTINDWLVMSPQAGSCLVLSNQPYVLYQHSVVQTALPQEFYVETVGKAVDEEDDNNAVYLDTVARWLYQEKQRLEQKKNK
ncbi:hypothetical protein K2X40_03505 [Candidatus Babeliales bacterium]|nr:hypothetical protein [Candidatus Babeliales bacterium]